VVDLSRQQQAIWAFLGKAAWHQPYVVAETRSGISAESR